MFLKHLQVVVYKSKINKHHQMKKLIALACISLFVSCKVNEEGTSASENDTIVTDSMVVDTVEVDTDTVSTQIDTVSTQIDTVSTQIDTTSIF
jgi:hypothetical protein